MSRLLEWLLRLAEPSVIAEVFLWYVSLLFIALAVCRRYGRWSTLTTHASALLASVGILGTFIGIVVGLLDFDPTQLDSSIESLLEGLKTAFISSIAGIGASLLFRFLEPVLTTPPHERAVEFGPEDIIALLKDQQTLLASMRDAIGGEQESSLAGQLKLLRLDLGDYQKNNTANRKQFEEELWNRMHSFAEMLSKSATEQVIEALKSVIVDFNRNLTEQFGDNFKKLDQSVQKLVEWQKEYRNQLQDLHSLYEQSVQKIVAIEASVRQISVHCATIPDSMKALSSTMEVANHQISELERHLAAFASLRERAIEAVPEAKAHIETMTREIAAAVTDASQQLSLLQNDTQKQVKNLALASQGVQEDIKQIQENVSISIRNLQAQVQDAIEDALEQQRQASNNVAQMMLDETRKSMSRTSEGLNKQIEALDEALSKELNVVMQEMANALSQIAGKFVEDYSKLVQQMDGIIRRHRRSGEWQ